MTGFEIYKRCLALLGYTSSDDETVQSKTLLSRMPEIINQIALDLRLEPISSLSSKIDAEAEILDALCNGCAMLLALSEGDGGKNQLFATIYNSKRASALGGSYIKSDVLPSPFGGGV